MALHKFDYYYFIIIIIIIIILARKTYTVTGNDLHTREYIISLVTGLSNDMICVGYIKTTRWDENHRQIMK